MFHILSIVRVRVGQEHNKNLIKNDLFLAQLD